MKAPESGLSAQLDATDGNYQLTSQDPAWTLGGSLGLPLTTVTSNRGRGNAGNYQQIAFERWVGQMPMRGRFLLYTERAVALFSQACGAASETAPTPFPAFTNLPATSHVFSHGQDTFAPPEFTATPSWSPASRTGKSSA